MKSQKGMSHLMSTIFICIIIIAIVGIGYFVKNQIYNEQIENYQTDMLLIQGKVKVLAQEAIIQKNDELLKGRKVEDNLEDEEVKRLLENNTISQDEENFSKYYILDKENLNDMGLESIKLTEGFYIVNYSTYEIIYSKGVNIENETYYKLSEIQEQVEKKNEIKEENNVDENEQNDEQEPAEETTSEE